MSIGEFSKICEVSAKTLRYYDEIGLIHPEEINPINGYRYYSIRQLKRMLFINRLKSYRFTLEEIKALLNGEEDPFEEKLHVALSRKRREIHEQLAAYECTLIGMERDISNIERGIPIMSYMEGIDVQLAQTEALNILSIRATLSAEDYDSGYEKHFGKLYEKIASNRLTPLGTPMTIYHSSEYDPSGNDTEFAIPVQEAVTGTRDFPGSFCAKSILQGPYPELSSVYARIREWMEEEGYAIANAPYEVYVTNPHHASVPEDIVTEVYFPITKNRRLSP